MLGLFVLNRGVPYAAQCRNDNKNYSHLKG
jgi:hypothetical protein